MRDRLTASTWWTGILLGLGSLLVTVSVVLAVTVILISGVLSKLTV